MGVANRLATWLRGGAAARERSPAGARLRLARPRRRRLDAWSGDTLYVAFTFGFQNLRGYQSPWMTSTSIFDDQYGTGRRAARLFVPRCTVRCVPPRVVLEAGVTPERAVHVSQLHLSA